MSLCEAGRLPFTWIIHDNDDHDDDHDGGDDEDDDDGDDNDDGDDHEDDGLIWLWSEPQ